MCAPRVANSDSAIDTFRRIEIAFSQTPRNRVVAALTELARRHPESPLAARSLLWRGDLLLQARDRAGADASYRAAQAVAHEPIDAALAWRGLGNVALERHAWRDAEGDFARASLHASGILANEIEEKRLIAHRELVRYRLEVAAWLVVVLVGGVLAVRVMRSRARAWPREATFLLPVYATFVALGLGKDRRVLDAVVFVVAGSLTLTTLLLAVPSPSRWSARTLLVLAVSIANASLVYASCRRAGIVDSLQETLRGGSESG